MFTLYIICLISLVRSDTVGWSTNGLDQTVQYRRIGIEAGSGTYEDTTCKLIVGYYTQSGGFGCEINGISLGGIEWCYIDTLYGIFTDDPVEFGVFVAQEQGCNDGVQIIRVNTGVYRYNGWNLNDYDSWEINQWIKESRNDGMVYKKRSGEINVVNADFISSSKSVPISPIFPTGINMNNMIIVITCFVMMVISFCVNIYVIFKGKCLKKNDYKMVEKIDI